MRLWVVVLAFAGLSAGASVATAAAPRPAGLSATVSSEIGYGYVPMSPYRAVDTRVGRGAHRLTAGQTVDVAMDPSAQIPDGASAVVVNVSAIGPSASGYVNVVPWDGSVSNAQSTLHVQKGQATTNEAIVRLTSNQQLSVFSSVASDVLIDVLGYFEKGAAYRPTMPARVRDTRTSGPVPTAGSTTTVQITGKAGVPTTGVAAVVLNVGAISGSTGWLSTFPSGTTRSSFPALVTYGAPRSGLTVSKVGSGGAVSIYSSQGTHLVVDVLGWVPTAGSDYVPIAPARLADSHSGVGVPKARLAAGATTMLTVAGHGGVPATGVRAVQLTVRAVDPASAGWLRVGPNTGTSTLNFPAHLSLMNSTTVAPNADGKVEIYNSAATDLIVDVIGYVKDLARPLQVDPKPLREVWQGQTYEDLITPMGGRQPYRWSVVSGSPPPGLVLAGSGYDDADHLTGATDRTGTWTFTVQVDDASGQRASRTYTIDVTPQAGHDVDVVAGDRHSCARQSSGAVYCWGAGAHGQLGNGSTSGSAKPVAVTGLSDVVQLSAGGDQTCALMRDGAVKCWGLRLPGASPVESSTPVAVNGLAGAALQIAVGTQHACAALTSGAVQCWGANDKGQSGHEGPGTLTPTTITGLGVKANYVGAGAGHSCAIGIDASTWCWGANDRNQFGNRSTVGSTSPTRAAVTAPYAARVDAGGNSTCLLDANQSRCFGQNDLGQAGVGSTTDVIAPSRSLPQAVPAASISTTHSCRVDRWYAVVCSGSNRSGQLGDGTTESRTSPVTASISGSASSVAAGTAHSCAAVRAAELTVYCWGGNDDGQLGIGTTDGSTKPVKVVFPTP
ncbi:RCC1 domain-containing protein [Luteipulveratus mongoliensis]|uniref:RCC1 domain-containing protein n=1 Tax=Luteipulveratus mongoliensis TaxID=571913 RepID=UPI0012EE31EE|nr:putative Ig domain-containing protein [Luteipulveratus mongoliensis]